MPQDLQVDKTIGDIITDLLKQNEYTSFFENYYYGDPVEIPRSVMPCICISPISGDIGKRAGPTGMDEIHETWLIKLIINAKDELGGDPESVTGIRTLEKMVKGIDPITKEYDTRTVAGVLRKYFTMQDNVVDQDFDFHFPDGSMRRPNTDPTAEAHITFNVTLLKVVSGRV